jgi:cell division protein FtsA
MNQHSVVRALDIGSSKICLTEARMNAFGRMEILAHASVKSRGVKGGTIQNIDQVVNELEHLKHELDARSQTRINEVSVNVGSPLVGHHWAHHTIFQSNREGVFSKHDLEKMVEDVYQTILPSGHTILHVLPFSFEIDDEIIVKDPVGVCGNRMDGTFRVISIDYKALRAIKRCLELSGMKIDELLIQPLSSAKSVVCQEEKELGVCIVDIGAGTTDISIYKDNALVHLSSLPLGADLINKDLQLALSINEKQAEAIKCKLGHAIVDTEDERAILSIPPIKNGNPRWIPVINIANIIEARMAEILEAVHKEILTTHLELESGIALTGGGAKLSQIDVLCEWICQMPSRIALPNENIVFEDSRHAMDSAFSACLGLAYHSLSKKIALHNQNSEEIIAPENDYAELEDFAERFKTSEFIKQIVQKMKVILLDDVRYDYPSK